MLAFTVLPNKYSLMWAGAFSRNALMLINITEEKPQHNTCVLNINPGDNVFTFYTRPGVNDHILPPTKAAADFITKIVAE